MLTPQLRPDNSAHLPNAPVASVRSMTGYAVVRRETSAGELTISLRSVNHRGLDLHFHALGDLTAFENAMRAVLKQNLGRGHVEIRIALKRDIDLEPASYNRELLGRYLSSFRQACAEFEIDSKPDLNVFFAMPGILDRASDSRALDSTFEAEILSALQACLDHLNAYREQEARELCAGLEPEISAIAEQTREIEHIRAEALPHFHERLRERLKDLLGDAGVSETRLAEEAAVLSERSDVQEELIRLNVHTEELKRVFQAGGEIGKRLDFLLQEMNRETNTILSKTSSAGEAGLKITNFALGIKANIEKIREQALNLE